MRFNVFLAFTTTLFVAVLATPVAETNGEYRLGYKEECASDGSLGLCMPGYYCKVQYSTSEIHPLISKTRFIETNNSIARTYRPVWEMLS
jgi:hypothetical protein